MMFTPQQLQGSSRFGSKTKIGNWSEDIELDAVRFQDYLRKKQSGELLVNKTQQKLSIALQPAELTLSADGYLHDGATVVLMNAQTKGLLAADPWERVNKSEVAYAVTTTSLLDPCARTAFIVIKVDNDGDDVIKFGQKIRIQSNPLLVDTPMYLHSEFVSPSSFSKYSRRQEVCVVGRKVWETVWQFEHVDPKLRFEAVGSPVPCSGPVLLQHCHTAHFLASDNVAYPNDFGREFEVCCHSFLTTNKYHTVKAEREGKLTSDIPTKSQYDQNVFIMLSADAIPSNSSPAVRRSSGPSAALASSGSVSNSRSGAFGLTADELMRKIREAIKQKGRNSLRGLVRAFQKMDINGNRTLDAQEFKWGLHDYGIELSSQEHETLVALFDRNRDGVIDLAEFIRALRGADLSERRLAVIQAAWEKVDPAGSGAVSLLDLQNIYDTSSHPDVRAGRKTEQEVLTEFMSQWDTSKGYTVTSTDFLDFYKDLSAVTENDDFFEAVVVAAWNL